MHARATDEGCSIPLEQQFLFSEITCIALNELKEHKLQCKIQTNLHILCITNLHKLILKSVLVHIFEQIFLRNYMA